MCLANYPDIAEQYQERFAGQTITAWKVLLLTRDARNNWPMLTSPFYHHTWRVGENLSTAPNGLSDLEIVEEGIHVFMSETQALNKASVNVFRRVVQVQCEVDNLIGVEVKYLHPHSRNLDDNTLVEAVFQKVTLTQEEYDKALNS